MNSEELGVLLRAATPLPWVVQIPGDNDPGAGTVFIDTHAYSDGPEPVVAASYPLHEADARLIVGAVNALPALLAERKRLREGLERLANATEGLKRVLWTSSGTPDFCSSSPHEGWCGEVHHALGQARFLLAEQEATDEQR